MSRINSTNIPEWVNWLAQDADGCWWGFEVEPNASHIGWYENEIGRYLKLDQQQPNFDWLCSLKKLDRPGGL